MRRESGWRQDGSAGTKPNRCRVTGAHRRGNPHGGTARARGGGGTREGRGRARWGGGGGAGAGINAAVSEETSAAKTAGVFRVPAFVVGNQGVKHVVWGQDRLDLVMRFAAGWDAA